MTAEGPPSQGEPAPGTPGPAKPASSWTELIPWALPGVILGLLCLLLMLWKR